MLRQILVNNKRVLIRSFRTSSHARAEKEEAHKIGKKAVDKIRQEEASKEKHPSPISPQSREKLNKMEKKTQEHDQKKK